MRRQSSLTIKNTLGTAAFWAIWSMLLRRCKERLVKRQ